MTGRNFTPFPILKTERLILRQLTSTDDNEIFALRSNSNVNKYLDRQPSKTVDDAKTFIQIINENIQKNHSIYWAIVLKSSNKLIGAICLFNFSEDNTKAEIGYELLPDFQGKGVMQEAASNVIDFGSRHIGLRLIEAYTHSENQSSTRLLKKFNFKKYSNADNKFAVFKLTIDK